MTPLWARRKRVEERRVTREFARMAFYPPRVHLAPPNQWDVSVDRMHVLPDPLEAVEIDTLRRRFGLPEQETP